MEQDLKILIIDSDEAFVLMIEEKLRRLGYNSYQTTGPDASIYYVEKFGPDLAILGPSLELGTCLRCLNRLKIICNTTPILISCQDHSLLNSPEGAPFNGLHSLGPDPTLEEISGTIEKALRHKTECEALADFPVLIGQSQVITEIRKKVLNVADKDVTVLITGESGTGKEMIARSIHYYSQRNRGPLVKITCGALPDDLLESEVFGFQKGAFTDAYKEKPGRIELAHGGTLFIDEIGNLSLSLQAKFLQVLEDKAFSRLGGTLDKLIDMRVVAATNTDLWEKVRNGTFRNDLYYRLDVVNVKAPPLRERKEDIPLLAHYFLNKYCFEYKKDPLEAPDEVIKRFMAYHWPGNVRELENVIRMAIAIRDWEFVFKELSLEKLNPSGESLSPSGTHSGLPVWGDEKIKGFFQDKNFSLKRIAKAYVSEVEREAILRVLKATDWNRRKAAERLQVSYKTFRNRLSDLGLKPK
ncbi:MAG: sigma-54 dependent transcriptional regulator [Pseudomonadota bacterium]